MEKKVFLTKSLLLTGIIAFLWYLYILFFCDLKDSNLYWLLAACVTALLFPVSLLYKKGLSSDDIKKGVLILLTSLLLNIAFVYFGVHHHKNFIDNLFYELTCEAFRWIYLALLIFAGISSAYRKKLGVWVTSIILGIVMPAILTAIFYTILILIGILYFVAYLLGPKDSSSSSISQRNLSSSFPDANNTSPRHVPDNTSYYTFFIAWSDGIHAPYTCTEKYPKDVSASRVASDLKKKFGVNARLLDYHIWDPNHDSALNYR